MNIKKIITVGVAGVAMGALALDNVEVTDVKARQRYPWNGKVDIDFTLDSKATEPYQMQVEVYDNVGKTNLPVKSVCTENVSVEANPCMVRTDTTRIVWDAAKDLPNGFKCTNVLVTCRDARTIAVSNLYCVIDLTTGAKEYLSGIPAGGWTDEHKTTKMVFRRIEAGSFMMGSSAAEINRRSNEDLHAVTITQSFYMAIYEMTEAQYGKIVGATSDSELPKRVRYGAVRGNDVLLYGYKGSVGPTPPSISIAEETAYCWPKATDVDASSIVGVLRTRAGISSLDLPTEAQWEFAARGGSNTALNSGYSSESNELNCIARNDGNRNDHKGDASQTAATQVGCYQPNALGLYDMLGNVREWCLDAWLEHLGSDSVINPKGASSSVVETQLVFQGDIYYAYGYYSARVVKGGGWYDWAYSAWDSNYRRTGSEDSKSAATLTECRSAWRDRGYVFAPKYDSLSDYMYSCEGVRLVFAAE